MKYDKDVDYQALIDQAVAAGDYKAAGQYEQQRNAKIAGEGITDYKPTYNFGSVYDQEHFTNEELGSAYKLRQAAQGGGADLGSAHDYVEQTRKNYGYSGGTDGSAYIPLQQQKLPSYITGEGEGGGTDWEFPTFSYKDAPSYVSKYQDLIDQLRGTILDRDPFSYDPETDPLYAQYRDSYTRGGQRAMQDTLGQVSARTGGLASSYAGSAAQQTYDGYMSELAAKIPELRQLAYQMYQDEGQQQRLNLDMITALEREDYGRYQDLLSQYNADRSFAYGQHRDEIADQQYKQQWDYQVGRDEIADQRYQQQWDYQVGRDQIEDQRYQQQWDYEAGRDQVADQRYQTETDYAMALRKAENMAQYGDFSGYKALGYTDEEIERLKAGFDAAQQLAASARASSSSGSSGSSGKVYQYDNGTALWLTDGSSGSGSSKSWADVEEWVNLYGAKSAENYIKENYKALGYSNQSTALAGWKNYLTGQGLSYDTGSDSKTPKKSDSPAATQKWDDVEKWVSLYGEKSAEDYIKEHYKALGYPNQSTALAGWKNYKTAKGRDDAADKLAGGGPLSMSEEDLVAGILNHTGVNTAYIVEQVIKGQNNKTLSQNACESLLSRVKPSPGEVAQLMVAHKRNGNVTDSQVKFFLDWAGFPGFKGSEKLGWGRMTDLQVIERVLSGQVELYTDGNGELCCRRR